MEREINQKVAQEVLKEMLTTASFIDPKINKEFSCLYCQFPVLDPKHCTNCGYYICSICDDIMKEGDARICPYNDCKDDPFVTA